MTYDQVNDVLYVNFAPREMAYGDEYGGVVLMRDLDTDEVIGIMVFNPKRHRKERDDDFMDISRDTGFVFDLDQVAF